MRVLKPSYQVHQAVAGPCAELKAEHRGLVDTESSQLPLAASWSFPLLPRHFYAASNSRHYHCSSRKRAHT